MALVVFFKRVKVWVKILSGVYLINRGQKMKYRKKPETVIVEAVQWFKLGDHPKVTQFEYLGQSKYNLLKYIDYSKNRCKECNLSAAKHGELIVQIGNTPYTKAALPLICPGEWILTYPKYLHDSYNDYVRYTSDEFYSLYEPIEEETK